jgi:hypothetical protein
MEQRRPLDSRQPIPHRRASQKRVIHSNPQPVPAFKICDLVAMHRTRVIGPSAGVRIRYYHEPDRFYPLAEYNPITVEHRGFQSVEVVYGWFAHCPGDDYWTFGATADELQAVVSARLD